MNKKIKSKKISVVVCTYNRCKLLNNALKSLISQSLAEKYYEVIVVDNNSSDQTKKIVNDFIGTPIRYCTEKEQGLSYARNLGIKEAKGDYIAFIDDDAIADRMWLETALSVINRISPKIFGGIILPYYETDKPYWFKDKYEIREPAKTSGYLEEDNYLSGSNIFFNLSLLHKIGVFKTSLGMQGNKISVGEEVELQKRARTISTGIYYDPKLIVNHLVSKEKMSLRYITKRHLISSRVAYGFLHVKWSVGNIRAFARNLIIMMILIPYFPFRNRRRYPFWQNFYIERIIHRFRSFLWFYWDLSGLIRKNDRTKTEIFRVNGEL